ncbi:MAG: YggT family protein [Candidatus Omnitrophica bacterium]|nr:YggT family protein [Candidatus Omnitrophota bacterium]MCK5288923.1 YggT family protein [Candidatus Omnitrophota bacterium]MCK5393218.1 YggT family protein [Candidatus Omnitrophota bacterium]
MFIISNFLFTLAGVLSFVLKTFNFIIFVRVIMSWVSADPRNKIVQFILNVTEPILAPIRRVLPVSAIDLSPMIAFFLIMFLRGFVVRILYDLAFHYR